MSSIDFPEYLDVDLSTSPRRRNSVLSNSFDVEKGAQDFNGDKKSKPSRGNSLVEGAAMARNSITSISGTIKHLGTGKEEDPELIPNEEVNEDQVGVVFEDGRNNALPPTKSVSSLLSIESLASFASSTTSLEEDEGVVKKIKDDDNSEEEEGTKNKGFRKYIGIFLTLLSGLLYSLAALLVKLLKDDYHPFMISIWRFQGVFFPSILLVLYRVCYMKQPDFKPVWPLKDNQKIIAFSVLMLRGLLGTWSVVLQFYSLQYLEVADSMVITSSTSVFVTLLAHCFIGEKCAIIPIITALLTMTGVFIISRPPMLTGKEEFDTQILIGVGMACGCMFLAAAILVMQRYLRNSHFSLIQLSSGLWGTLQCVILTFAAGVFKLPENSTDAMYGIALAVLTFFAQSFVVIALKFEQAGPVAVVQSCDVIFAFFWQFAFLGVVPDYFSLIGTLVIIAGLLLTAFRKCLIVLPEDDRTRKRFRFLLM